MIRIIGIALVAIVCVCCLAVIIGCGIVLLGGYNNETNDKEEKQ